MPASVGSAIGLRTLREHDVDRGALGEEATRLRVLGDHGVLRVVRRPVRRIDEQVRCRARSAARRCGTGRQQRDGDRGPDVRAGQHEGRRRDQHRDHGAEQERRRRIASCAATRATLAGRVATGAPSRLVLVEQRQLADGPHHLGGVRILADRAEAGEDEWSRRRQRSATSSIATRIASARRVPRRPGPRCTRAATIGCQRADVRASTVIARSCRNPIVPSGVSPTSGTEPVIDSTITSPSA